MADAEEGEEERGGGSQRKQRLERMGHKACPDRGSSCLLAGGRRCFAQLLHPVAPCSVPLLHSGPGQVRLGSPGYTTCVLEANILSAS